MRRTLILSAVAGRLVLPAVAFAGDDTDNGRHDQGRGPVVTFAVYGDAPYGTSPTDTAEFAQTPHFIDAVNADLSVDLVLHVGDIHSGSQYCTEDYDRSIFDLWTGYKKPLVYTPGDNEWTDCNKKKEGGGAYNATTHQIDYVLDASGNPVDYAKGDPVANLALIRAIFFAHPGDTLGGGHKKVLSQAQAFERAHASDAKYVENVMFEEGRVLVVTINLPGGSNNDTDVWYGAPMATPAQDQEVEERTGADLRWLDAAFDRARSERVAAVVIQAQADMWDPEKGREHQAGYEPFVKSVAEHTAALGKPVLMLNGDSHVFLSDNPLSPADPLSYMHPGYDVPNFHRLVVHGSTFPLEYLRLTFDGKQNAAADDPDGFGPFHWEQVRP
jgi:hypothetical protein